MAAGRVQARSVRGDGATRWGGETRRRRAERASGVVVNGGHELDVLATGLGFCYNGDVGARQHTDLKRILKRATCLSSL